MSSDKPRVLGPQEFNLSMTAGERSRASVLIIDPNSMERQTLRQTIRALGYGGIGDAPNHMTALERVEERKFSHVIFDAKDSNMPVKEFVKKLLELDATTIAIASSSNPSIDDVFELLILGAKGYLCKPFTSESIEQAIVMATKGEPIADAVLHAKDRNEALVAVLMASLDRAATIMRQAQKFDTAKREIPRVMSHLKRASDLAKMFSQGGEEGLLAAMESFCIERSKGPATRLGRLRKRLRTTRRTDDDDESTDTASS